MELSDITSSVANSEQPVEQRVRLLIEELKKLDRTYFGKDRVKQMKAKLDQAVTLLDEKPIDMISNKKEKAELLYLRGQTLDFLPEYTKQSEDFLSKCLKLMPTKKEAWDALGHVYWKKNDLEQSAKCFESSLEQDDKNIEILRNLSMVCRQIKTTDESKRKANFARSIELATKAVSLDMKDSQSWCKQNHNSCAVPCFWLFGSDLRLHVDVLGNAHLTNFFTNGESVDELTKALKAFSQSENFMTDANPDLFFNRATILEYLERYGEAIRDYNRAHQIDPALQADVRAGKLLDYVVQTASLIQSRSGSKQKKQQELARSVPTKISQELRFPKAEETKTQKAYRCLPISELANGVNLDSILPVKVVMYLDKPNEVPMSFLVVDSKQCYAVVSFYHTSQALKENLQSGDLLHIKNPQLIFTSLDFKNRSYSYNCIKIAEIMDVLVNGQPVTDQFAQAKVQSNNFA